MYKLGYRVLSDGTIISKTGATLKGSNSSGYLRIATDVKGKRVRCQVHRLQAFQKYGMALYADGIVARHLNGIQEDNSWDNVAIGTHSDNRFDIPKHIRISTAIYASSFIKKHNHEEIAFYYDKCRSYKKTMAKFNLSSKGTLHWILKKMHPQAAGI